jgi:hypothetical protein
MNTSTVIEYSSYGREKFENLEKIFFGEKQIQDSNNTTPIC